MAKITDYASLKEEIQAKMARSDLAVTDNLDAFIDYAESDFDEKLRVRDMITEDNTLVTVGGVSTVSLPSDFLQIDTLSLESDPKPLKYVTPQQLKELGLGRNDITGRPNAFTIVSGKRLKFGPSPDGAYDIELEYYQSMPKLNNTTQTTNWLIDRKPLLYLYRALYHGFNQIRDFDNANMYGRLSFEIMENMEKTDENNETGTSGMQVRGIGNGP